MNLKDLIAKGKPSETPKVETPPEVEKAVESKPTLPLKAGTAFKLGNKTPSAAVSKESKVAPAAPAGLKLGGLAKAVTPAPQPAEIPADLDLSSLAALDTSEIPESGKTAPAFPDEIEATAPARELPADLSAQQLNFVESLDVIYTALHDPDMMGQAIRSVMQELQESPEFIQLVSDHDVHTMIKAIRNVMGIAKIRKEEKSTKRTAGTRTKRTASSKFDEETLSSLNELFAGMPSDD